MRRLLQRKLCRRKTLLFTLFLLSLIIGTTPASAKEVTDVLTNDGLIKETTTNYTAFSGRTFTSKAVYAGTIAGDGGTIQLTNKTAQASYIATTGSGGVLKKIKLYWNTTKTTDSSKNPRKLSIYAQDKPYTTTYRDNKVGTNVFSLQYSKDNPISEYTFEAEYTYIALFAINGACYFDKIEITWEDGTTSEPQNFDSAHDQFTGLTWNGSAYDLTMTYGDKFTLTPKSSTPPAITYAVADGAATDVVSIEGNKLTALKAGTTKITASWPADDNWNAGSRTINVTVNHAQACGPVTFDLTDGSEVEVGTILTISSENAKAIHLLVKNGETVLFNDWKEGSSVTYTLDKSCTITAYAKNAEEVLTQEASASYTVVVKPKYVKFTEYGADNTIPDGKYIFVGYKDSDSSYHYMTGAKVTGSGDKTAYFRTTEGVTLDSDGTIKTSEIDSQYEIDIKKEANGNYSLITTDSKYLYADGVKTTLKEGDSAAGLGMWKPDVNGETLKFDWVGEGGAVGSSIYINTGATPPRFTNYTTPQTKFYLYKLVEDPDALGNIKFSPASGSTVDEGTEITISAQNATSLAYSIKTGDVWSESVKITGNSVNVQVTEDCTISVIAKNDETLEQKSAEATYTVVHPVTYELVEEYNGNVIPDGDYIFASSKDDGSSFAIMGEQTSTTYRESILVTLTDNKFDAYSRYAIKVQKEGNDNYSLITSDGKYLYSNSSQDLKEGDDTYAGKWIPTITGDKVEFSYDDETITDGALLKYNPTNTRFKAYKTTSTGVYPISLYTVQSTKCGSVIFDPAPGSEVPINSTVKISCKNATQISYSITKNEGPSTNVVVPGSVAEVTITEDCIIEAKGTNEEGDSDIAEAIYSVQTPFTLYTDFYEETGAPYIPDGNYVLVGSVSTGESAGEYYMAEQKDTYRVANKIQPLEDGRLPIDNKYQINIKKEDSGNYSLTTADGKYIYAVSSTTTSGEGESQTTTTTYSVKEGEAADGQGKWKANIEKGKVYFSWAEPSYGDFKFNPQSPRFKTYDPANTNLVSFSLYSTNIPLCRDLKFDHADGSTVVRGSTVTISCINAAKIFYAVGNLGYVTVEGNKASVIISEDCSVIAYAENAEGVETKDAILAYYTVTDPYVEFAGYGSDGSIPDGEYIFVGKTGTNGDLRYMAEQATTSDNITYRKAVLVTPFDDGRIGVSDKYAITVKKEEGANYSLITADGKYLYANSSTSTTGEGESQVTTTNYSVVEGDKTAGEGKWKASVDINNGTVEFVWNDDASTLRYYASGENSRFKPYKNEAPITGTKFYLYAPTPKPEPVVCTDATITNEEIHIAVKKTITFKSEGAGKMACKVLDSSNVETFDIVNGDTYTFTAASEPTEQIITIIPYDQYGAAYNPSKLEVFVYTHDLPEISYNFVDGEDKAAFYAENGIITEIRPYRIDGTLEEAGTYSDNVIPFRFSQPRFKVTASNKYGDTVKDISFIKELCNRNNMEGGAYTVAINYKDANSEAVASFPIAETERGSLKWTMDGYLVNESDDILDIYPFLIKESYITLHIAPYGNTDGPTILNVKIATPADGGEGVYGAPAHAPATGDLVATVGNYNFVVNGGSPLYFDGQDKNFIKGNIEVSPFEYANIRITSIEDVTTAVSDILDEDAEEVFYNLQGVRVENPDKGIYIRVKGNKTEKILK